MVKIRFGQLINDNIDNSQVFSGYLYASQKVLIRYKVLRLPFVRCFSK